MLTYCAHLRISLSCWSLLLQGALALVPSPNYAVFNNGQSRELIKSWAPKFVRSSEPGGSGLTPSSTENMQRFVMLSRLELWNLTPTRADSRTPPPSLSLSLSGGGTAASPYHPRAFTPPARIHSTAVRRSRHTCEQVAPQLATRALFRRSLSGALSPRRSRLGSCSRSRTSAASHRSTIRSPSSSAASRVRAHANQPARISPTRISPREFAHTCCTIVTIVHADHGPHSS